MNSSLTIVAVSLALVVTLGWAFWRIQKALHMLQLDSYANHRECRSHPDGLGAM
jgi:hypothetical protein